MSVRYRNAMLIEREGAHTPQPIDPGESFGALEDETGAETPAPSDAATVTPEAEGDGALLADEAAEATASPSPTIEATASPTPEAEPAAPVMSFGVGFIVAAVLLVAWIATLAAFLRSRSKKRAPQRAASSMTPYRRPSGMNIGNLHNIGMRGNQEDSFAISGLANAELIKKHGVLAVVADGMGGLENGEVVSGAVTATFMRAFSELPEQLTPTQKLLLLARLANDEACRSTGGTAVQSGSTLVSALVKNGLLWFVSVGDSRICLFRGGASVQLTREHVYAADLDLSASRGSISFEEASADGQRHALTSYIGTSEPEHIDFNLNPIQLLAGDWVILMSDGVFNTLSDEEIASALRGNVHEAAAAVEDLVLRRQTAHQDNFTAILLQIT